MNVIITNKIEQINSNTIEVPLIVRSDQEGWVPSFEVWPTTITGDTSFIDCTQNFRAKLKTYDAKQLNAKAGIFENDNLVIYWKALINTEKISTIHNMYSGKLRATSWQNRYCTYFGTGSNMPWLHTTILGFYEDGYVIHHIDGVSVDNRNQNLHILPKREHDSINHPLLDERKIMFADPQAYWQQRRLNDIDDFINQMALLVISESQIDFITEFAKTNLELAKQILQRAKMYINLSLVKSSPSDNRKLNPHLSTDYLDAYEIEKYLKKTNSNKNDNQLKLF